METGEEKKERSVSIWGVLGVILLIALAFVALNSCSAKESADSDAYTPTEATSASGGQSEAAEDMGTQDLSFSEYAEQLGERAVSGLSAYDASYMVTDSALWITMTLPATREEMVAMLKSAGGLETHQTLRTEGQDTCSNLYGLIRDAGYSGKGCALEIGLTDGTELLSFYNDSVKFDLADYEGLN